MEGKRGTDLQTLTEIADNDVLIVDTAGGTRAITYAQLCAAVKDTLGIREVVESTNITEPGFLMDGKTASEAFAELYSKIGMLNCSFTSSTIHDTSFADALTDVRAQKYCVGFLSYYRISDAPQTVPNGFLVYFCNNELSTQITLLAFWANKMAMGIMTRAGSITWADI